MRRLAGKVQQPMVLPMEFQWLLSGSTIKVNPLTIRVLETYSGCRVTSTQDRAEWPALVTVTWLLDPEWKASLSVKSKLDLILLVYYTRNLVLYGLSPA